MSVPYVQEDSLIFRELYKTIFLGHTVCIEIPLFPNGLKIKPIQLHWLNPLECKIEAFQEKQHADGIKKSTEFYDE